MYGNSNPLTGEFLALGIGIFILYLILVVGIVVLITMYYKTLIEVMAYVRPENRQTGVANILFMFIPLFSLVYGFIVYPRISDSIKKEYNSLGLSPDGDFGRSISIAMCATSFGFLIPFLNFIAPIAVLILWIILWVKINNYREVLMSKNNVGFINPETYSSVSSNSDILD